MKEWTSRPVVESDIEVVARESISRGFVGLEQTNQVADAVEKDGNIIMVGGLIFLTPTTAWCWVELTKYGIKNIVTSYRVIKEWLDISVEKYKLSRVQAYSRCEFKESQRMLEHLGFEKESKMKNFTPEGDAFMFVRIRSN